MGSIRTGLFFALGLGALVVQPALAGFAEHDKIDGETYTIGPDGEMHWFRMAIGLEEARVAIDGDGTTDLDLLVWDEWADPLCEPRDDDVEECVFTPPKTQIVIIVVRNRSETSPNTFRLWIQ